MPALFALTLFVSATLLFLVQPMIAKMILPLLGGTPAVWNTCMVFFQALLLVGYLYAHVITSKLGVRKQAALHLGLLLLPILTLSLMTLPLQILHGQPSALGAPPEGGNPIPWLLALLLFSVGLPFFMVATSAPLLQKWFASTDHPSAKDPYFLYAASNLGSMLALVSYPALLEPHLRLTDQCLYWTLGYGLFVVLTLCCAVVLWRAPVQAADVTANKKQQMQFATNCTEGSRPSSVASSENLAMSRRLRWIALAFAPSSLLLGVTTCISTDIASIPLLWVVPLALYLLTFILVFSSRPLIWHKLVVLALPVVILIQTYWLLAGVTRPIWAVLLVHLLSFFLAALACHGELARDRPSTRHLTEFYLLMSVGGVLGGLFNALVAPLAFNTVAEYPLVIVLACMLLPSTLGQKNRPVFIRRDLTLPLGLGMVSAALQVLVPATDLSKHLVVDHLATYGLPAVLCFLFVARPLRFGLGVGAILLAGSFASEVFGPAARYFSLPEGVRDQVVYRQRSFFGVLKVVDDSQGLYRRLIHGSTLHGRQRLRWNLTPQLIASFGMPLAAASPLEAVLVLASGKDGWIEPGQMPLTYYHRQGPIGQVFAVFSGPKAKKNIALIGLGTGSMACYGQPGQELTFYEIDRAVLHIAKTYFSFLENCRAKLNFVLGDARLQLASAESKKYGIILIDAFSSDAIPMHLLTQQAVHDVYLPKLADDGILIFHTSNRYLDLHPVLTDLAHAEGLIGRTQSDDDDDTIDKGATSYVILARKEADLDRLAQDARWEPLGERSGKPLWTDNFSNILSVLKFSVLDDILELYQRAFEQRKSRPAS